jgi:hypothetical protein
MPDFTRAEISADTPDLSAYRSFLKRLSPGQTVTLPLDEGETSRRVMRAMNAAAALSDLRLARLSSAPGTVRVRVLSGDKRSVNLTEEAKQARVAKARATRAARQQVKAMGLPVLVADPTGHQGDRPIDAALAAPDLSLEEAGGPDRPVAMTADEANYTIADLVETAAVEPPPDQQVQAAAVEEAVPAPTSSRRRRASRAAAGSKSP